MRGHRLWLCFIVASFIVWIGAAAPSFALPGDATVAGAGEDCAADVSTCSVDLDDPDLEKLDAGAVGASPTVQGAPDAGPLGARSTPARLQLFWGVGCPRCEQAKPFVAALEREVLGLVVERFEVRRDPEGRRRFAEEMRRLGATAVGVPTFVVGDAYVVGYVGGSTEEEVRQLVQRAIRGEARRGGDTLRPVDLPWVGSVDPAALSLPAFTLLIGLVDGINPCAMWVLLVLLGILTHVESRKRLVLFGGTFVVASGVVYFAFMTAWVGVFSLLGLSRPVTIVLGLVVLGMGLINLKELVWLKRGVSLTIPDPVKPKLYRRMRAIAGAASLPAAFLGIAGLAFLVNLVELGCTLGLPAVYTRILTLRGDVSELGRYGYLALYNVAYVVPLAVIVLAYALTLHRLTLSERGAKVLKGISGMLLLLFGLFFIFASTSWSTAV